MKWLVIGEMVINPQWIVSVKRKENKIRINFELISIDLIFTSPKEAKKAFEEIKKHIPCHELEVKPKMYM